MSRTLSPSTGKPYGLARVAAAWDLPRSTYYAGVIDGLTPSSSASGGRERRGAMRH